MKRSMRSRGRAAAEAEAAAAIAASSETRAESGRVDDHANDQLSKFLESIMNNEHNDKLLYEFEWPLKMYALISLRHKYHPVYLQRNLTYMSSNRRGSSSSRKSFSFDKLIKSKQEERKFEISLISLNTDTSQFFLDRTNSISIEFVGVNSTLRSSDARNVTTELIKQVDSDSLVLRNLQLAAKVKFSFDHSALWPDDLSCPFDPSQFDTIRVNLRINSTTYNTSFSSLAWIELAKAILSCPGPQSWPKSRGVYSLMFNDPSNNLRVINDLKFRVFKSNSSTSSSGGEKRRGSDVTDQPAKTDNVVNIRFELQKPRGLDFYRFDNRRMSKRFECPFCNQKFKFDSFKQVELIVKRHLSLNHFRFNFVIVKSNQNSLRCDVSINQDFDSSDSFMNKAVPRKTFNVNNPFYFYNSSVLKRARQTQSDLDDHSDSMIVCETRKESPRSYYSTRTYQVKLPKDLDPTTSENLSDDDSELYMDHMKRGIYEFQDVNDGEKELMILWNQFRMKHPCIADKQIQDACRAFIQLHCQDIIRLSLERNFLLHLSNLSNYNLLTPTELVHLVDTFNQERKSFYID